MNDGLPVDEDPIQCIWLSLFFFSFCESILTFPEGFFTTIFFFCCRRTRIYTLQKQISKFNSKGWCGFLPHHHSSIIHILIPQGANGSTIFLVSNESSYFSHYNHNTSASNSLYFGSYSRKCTYFRDTNFDFLNMYFHDSLIPSVTYLLLPQERKWKVNLR